MRNSLLSLLVLFWIGGMVGRGWAKGVGYDAKEKGVLVQGHRGSRGTHPENSIPAFEEAIEAGAQILELDLQLTRDDIPVIWHDAEIRPDICKKKGATKPIPIRSLLLKEVKQFQCGTKPHPRFPAQKKIAVRIVSLDEFLVWVRLKKLSRSIEFNMETKMTAEDPKWVLDPELFVRAIFKVLAMAGVESKTILQSFDFRTLKVARKLNPNIRLSTLFERRADFCQEAKALGASFVSPEFSLLNAEMIANCRSLGLRVAPWTLNTPEEWKIAMTLGVDSIITDYPRRLIDFLSQS